MARVLVPGGSLYVKSDHPAYAEIIESTLASCPELKSADPGPAFAGLPTTGFERKYLVEGRRIHAFAAKKVTR
jgi:tRNA G46 methylase TrmB